MERPVRKDQFNDRPWLTLSDEDLGRALNVPCMINPEETRFYHWLGRELAQTEGAVVELGSFLGGSTAHLAEGTMRGGGNTKKIFAYDQFGASEKVKERQLYSKGIEPFEGEDIMPLSKKLLEPWLPNIELRKGRIEDSTWNDGPISLLVLDASKTSRTMDSMAEIFFPHLVPGKSVIVQQDELHWKEPWIAVQMQRLADHFDPLCYVPGAMVAYVCKKKIDINILRDRRVHGLSDVQMQEKLSKSIERLQFLDVSKLIRRQKEALKLNPLMRKAWRFKVRAPRL